MADRKTTKDVTDFSDVKISIAVSLLAFPLLYIIDGQTGKLHEDIRTKVLVIVGFPLLFGVILVLAKISKLRHWAGYVFMLFVFTCMIDNIIALEYNGYIQGFMSQYLKLGEPYLFSPWGSAICLFDGTGILLMYLGLIHLISNGKPWRSLCIYWASAILNSMIVLLLGILAGRHSPTFCVFFNVPYTILPPIILIGVLLQQAPPAWDVESRAGWISGKLINTLIAAGLLFSIKITFIKGMLSLGSTFSIFLDHLGHEPALLDVDPAPFAKIQALLFLFYALPIQVVSLFYVFRGRKPKILWDLGLTNAGIFIQAQFSFIITALDPSTKEEFRSHVFDPTFWLDNLTLLIVPHVFLWMLYKDHHVHKADTRKGGSKTK